MLITIMDVVFSECTFNSNSTHTYIYIHGLTQFYRCRGISNSYLRFVFEYPTKEKKLITVQKK